MPGLSSIARKSSALLCVFLLICVNVLIQTSINVLDQAVGPAEGAGDQPENSRALAERRKLKRWKKEYEKQVEEKGDVAEDSVLAALRLETAMAQAQSNNKRRAKNPVQEAKTPDAPLMALIKRERKAKEQAQKEDAKSHPVPKKEEAESTTDDEAPMEEAVIAKREGQQDDSTPQSDQKPTIHTNQKAGQLVVPPGLDLLLDNIIAKWGLEAPNAKPLLQKLWNHDGPYDPSRDLVVFTHPMKSGGTSVSFALNQLGGTVPGSAKSDTFYFKMWPYKKSQDMQKARADKQTWNETLWMDRMKSAYSHTPFRRYGQGANSSGLQGFLQQKLPHRRFRHVTMVREPLAFTASNFNEWACRLGRLTKEAKKLGIPELKGTDYDGCNGYTIELLTKARIAKNQQQCQGFTAANQKEFQKDLRKRCKVAKNNHGDHKPECASVDAFLESSSYGQFFHDHDAYGRCTKSSAGGVIKRSTADHVEGALEYLGGLDAPLALDGTPNGDMMWFGITERMHESMCLLHYKLRLPWEAETPSERIQKCRPVKYWNADNKKKFYSKEPMMMAVHRAANAVMDLRLAKMRAGVAAIRQQKGGEDVHTIMDSIGSGCLQDVPELGVSLAES